MALYLVTGIAGFIGSSLARELVRRGESVRGIDNFSTGKRENIETFRAQIDFRKIDLLDLPAVADACRGVDYVLHQAAVASVPRSIADPIATNQANIDGTLNLLVGARDAKVKRVVYASSSSLYGDSPTLPKREDMIPDPISPYAVSKLTGEYYMTSFYRVYGLETVSLRYFNVFGPYQDPTSMYSGVLAIFITKMLAGEQPTTLRARLGAGHRAFGTRSTAAPNLRRTQNPEKISSSKPSPRQHPQQGRKPGAIPGPYVHIVGNEGRISPRAMAGNGRSRMTLINDGRGAF